MLHPSTSSGRTVNTQKHETYTTNYLRFTDPLLLPLAATERAFRPALRSTFPADHVLHRL